MSAFEDVVEAWGFKIAGDKPAVLSPAGIAPDGSIVYSDAESFRDLIGAEPELGNPSVNGWILSSSSAGVRSWVAPNAHSHAIADVTGLQTALNAKEAVLGNPATSGYVLASTTAGVRSWVSLPTIPVASVFGRTGAVVAASGDYTTAQVTESGNLYYTDARARAAISASAPLSYSGGVVSHLATDGNLHVPATSTTNNGKALVAGSTAGSIAWTSLAISHVTGLQAALDAKLSTVTADASSRAANTVYAAPNGSAGTATFRSLVAADIPSLDTSKLTSGTLGYARGGTGISAPGATAGNLRWSGSAYVLDTASYALSSAIPAASSTTPSALGTAAVGTGTTWARADHVHAMPTAAQVGAAASAHSHAIADVTGLQTALDGKQASLGYTPVNKAGDTMTGGLTLPTLSTTGLATLQSLNISSQTGTTVRPAIFNTDGTVLRDGNGTIMQRVSGGYVGVNNPSRLAGEFYEFWDPVGWADIHCGTIKLNSLTASTIPVIDANKKLASQDYATFRTTIGAANDTVTNMGYSLEGTDPFANRNAHGPQGGVRTWLGIGPFSATSQWHNVVDVRHRNGTGDGATAYGGQLVWGFPSTPRLAFRATGDTWTEVWTKENLINPVTGTGVSGRVAYWSGTGKQTSSANLTFDGLSLTLSNLSSGYRVNDQFGLPSVLVGDNQINLRKSIDSTALPWSRIRCSSSSAGSWNTIEIDSPNASDGRCSLSVTGLISSNQGFAFGSASLFNVNGSSGASIPEGMPVGTMIVFSGQLNIQADTIEIPSGQAVWYRSQAGASSRIVGPATLSVNRQTLTLIKYPNEWRISGLYYV